MRLGRPQRASEQNSGGWAWDHTWGLELWGLAGAACSPGQRMGIIWAPGTPGTRPRVVTLWEGHGSSVGSCWTDRLGTEEGPRENQALCVGPQEPSLEPNVSKVELRGQQAHQQSASAGGGRKGAGGRGRSPQAEGWQLGAVRVKARAPAGQGLSPRPGEAASHRRRLHRFTSVRSSRSPGCRSPGALCTDAVPMPSYRLTSRHCLLQKAGQIPGHSS